MAVRIYTTMVCLYIIIPLINLQKTSVNNNCIQQGSDTKCLQDRITHLENIIVHLNSKIVKPNSPSDCKDLFTAGQTLDGTYTIYPSTLFRPVEVLCDMTTNGGGWTIIQTRKDGSVNFNQTYNAYKNGFGSTTGELWLGNKIISALTSQNVYELYIHLEDFQGSSRYARYQNFYVAPGHEYFKLHIGTYSGNAGDSLSYHNGMKFSTFDADNDNNSKSCARQFSSGFWYNTCTENGLNNPYFKDPFASGQWEGIWWRLWRGDFYSLKNIVMKIRPVF